MVERQTVPVTVGIPTWARGEKVLAVLERVFACDPRPAEAIVHIDESDGRLERALAARFPSVKILPSPHRVGPGGGRHRCLLAATQPVFVSFDDDSHPLDGDYFAEVMALFAAQPGTALLAAAITHPWETAAPKSAASEAAVEFTGCGWAVRRDRYLACPGFVDRPFAYGIEEMDLDVQFLAAGFVIRRTGRLRVFHDTTLSHHRNPRQTASAIQNVALLAWLRYPFLLAGRALLQVANMAVDQARRGRWRGIPAGLAGIPGVLWRFRRLRRPYAAVAVRAFLARRKIPVTAAPAWREVRA